jgi:DNA-binding transcriptional MerR regulator
MSVSVGKMRIGEVHTLLRKDFPEIELSKIRYYEDKGLVEPSRSRKGYRLYSDRDVACLREAIRLAQEEFVPLRVVRLRLVEQGLLSDSPTTPVARHAARETSANAVSVIAPITPTSETPVRPALSVVKPPPASSDASVENSPTPRESVSKSTTSREYLTTQEFLKTTELEGASVNQLISMGLLLPSNVAGETVFTQFDVRVAQCATALLTRGVDGRLLGSLRRVVERELGVVDDLTKSLRHAGGRNSGGKSPRVAPAVASEVAALRTVLYERALAEYLQD